MKKDKEMSLDELENVSGGANTTNRNIMCPECKKIFDAGANRVRRGSGCDEETYIKCPHCSYEWK